MRKQPMQLREAIDAVSEALAVFRRYERTATRAASLLVPKPAKRPYIRHRLSGVVDPANRKKRRS